MERGLPEGCAKRLYDGLWNLKNSFRLELQGDPPIQHPPMKIQLKEGAIPRRMRQRRLSASEQGWLHAYLEELGQLGYMERVWSSAWASNAAAPPKPVEPGTDLVDVAYHNVKRRMVANYVYVNSQTVETGAPMPLLHDMQGSIGQAICFAKLDASKGYWQLGLDPESGNIMVIQAGSRLYKPLRAPQGATSSAQEFQSAMQNMVDDYYGKKVLVWIDDFLFWANNPEQLVSNLLCVLERTHAKGLKFSIEQGKADFYSTEMLWCGKLISPEGIRHHPGRLKDLTDMPEPRRASELVQFLSTANWMRDSLPEFAAIVRPLQDLLTMLIQHQKRRNKTAAAKISLKEEWEAEHGEAWSAAKDLLLHAVTLAHPDPSKALCAFSDASELFWGLMLSQLPKPELSNALRSSRHEPLAFLSGNFRENQLRWPIVDKEGYAVIQLYKVYHLIYGRRLHIFTDHRNLKYIWGAIPSTVSKATSQRLQSWQGIFGSLDYQIEHIPGEENHWGDMLSRWLGADLAQRAIQLKMLRLNHGVVYDNTIFQLPSIQSLRNQQLDELETLTSFDTETIELLCLDLNLERDNELLLFRHEGKV